MSLINISNLSFSYDGSYDIIFDDVGFQIDTDWKLGFIGRNGRGKTTFLNLLMGRYEYSGSISASVKFEYFPYPVKDKSLDTLDVMKSICAGCPEWKIIREILLLEVEEEALCRPFNTLSNGEQTKVLLASLFLNSGNFLLIDEPTNHLDLSARDTLKDYLNSKKGFILVSHDRKLLDGCVDHILSINKTNIEVQNGNFSSWWENKQQRDNFELAENKKLKGEIKRLSDSFKRSAGWSDKVEKTKYGSSNSGLKVDRGYVGAKSAKAMKRAKSIEKRKQKAVSQKSGLLHNIEEYDDLKISPLPYFKSRLLEVKDLSVFYGENEVFKNVGFTVDVGDRVALTGSNGSGKTSILKLILGQDIKHGGKVITGSRLVISYIPQDTSHLSGSLDDFIYRNGVDETLFKTILRKLDFSRDQFYKNLEDYSAGQKKKVLLAKSLSESAHLYVWDEPLNYIDVFSRIQIERLIVEYSPTLLFVEHDDTFAENISTKEVRL
ncbi:MAG: Lsa family ABC-F type ribosomal protection protein [Ruminococcaceae bacterium]|nr:Lsa family ABC-F type ribosomal protection protein [Oscillospiraceae bacterium]